MKDIAIYGAGGFGREVLTLLHDINSHTCEWNFLGFFDDGHPKGEVCNGYSILGGIDELNDWDKELNLVVAIGSPNIKKSILNNITKLDVLFPTLIHPSVYIGDSNFVTIGEGCIICAGNFITTNISIGNHVTLNLACTVGHDSIIKDFAAFMPSCNISGETVIGEAVYCGTGVKIINQIEIGNETIVGAGAVVAKSLPEKCTAVGVPAKPIKFRK